MNSETLALHLLWQQEREFELALTGQLVGKESTFVLDPDGFDTGVVATEDGCEVEPDGTCQHGQVSPLVRLGLV
jgi:hypothetical protein